MGKFLFWLVLKQGALDWNLFAKSKPVVLEDYGFWDRVSLEKHFLTFSDCDDSEEEKN